MIKKIKDLTKEELERYLNYYGYLSSYKNNEKLVESIFMLKDRYLCGEPTLSAEFLNTKIDIPDKHILDKEEHDYLRAVCKPYIKDIETIRKRDYGNYVAYIQLIKFTTLTYTNKNLFELPLFDSQFMYKGMKLDKNYTIEELELDKEWEE